jgi:hypothetical protein
MTIWYDRNGDLVEDSPEIITGTLATLALSPVELGSLPGFQVRRLKLAVHPLLTDGEGLPVSAPYSLDFMTEFQLVQSCGSGYSDTEISSSKIAAVFSQDAGGSSGFWKNRAVNEYGGGLIGKQTVSGWFASIVTGSRWFTDITITGDPQSDYNTMVGILNASGGSTYADKVNKFRSHYLATRLNAETNPPRLSPENWHVIAGVAGAENCFGYAGGTLSQIIASIESMGSDGNIFSPPPTAGDIEIMKDVCEALINVEI